MLLGVVIVVVVLFLPHGLVPENVEPVLPANRVRRVITDGLEPSKPAVNRPLS